MSSRTVMVSRAQPGRTPMIRMPSACEARSRSNIASATRVARAPAPSSIMNAPLSRPAGNSATRESRRPLGTEGGDAFGIIRAPTELDLIVALHVELLLECATEALVDGLLGAGQAPGRCAGEMRGE